MHILIVDDHAGMRALLRELLAEAFASTGGVSTIVECASGEAALEAVGTTVPRFVTVDVRMSGMSGLECVSRLRSRLPSAVIVVVTQFATDAMARRAMEAGADSIVSKDDLNVLSRFAQGCIRPEKA